MATTPRSDRSPKVDDTEKRPRIAFDVLGSDDDPQGVDWAHVRTTKAPRLKTLIQKEARAMGWAPAASDTGSAADLATGTLTGAQLFVIVSMVAQGAAIQLAHATPEEAALLGVTPTEIATIQKSGLTDKMIAKYFPSIAMALEITWGLEMVQIFAPKVMAFTKARKDRVRTGQLGQPLIRIHRPDQTLAEQQEAASTKSGVST